MFETLEGRRLMSATYETLTVEAAPVLDTAPPVESSQTEARRTTLISNIMKTKHDTAKSSISNVR